MEGDKHDSIGKFRDQPIAAILWEIKGSGINAPSYLLGTSHDISYDTLITRFPGLDRLLSQVDLLVEEHASATGASGVDEQILTFQGTDSTVGSLMTPRSFRRLKKYILAKSHGNPVVLDNLVKMRPQLLVLALPMLDADREMSHSDQVSMDEGFLIQARKQNIKYAGLENPTEASLVLRGGISDQKAIDRIMRVTQSSRKGKRHDPGKKQAARKFLYTADHYMQPSIYYYFGKTPATGDDYGGVTLRNKNWMQKIPSLLQKQKCLIAVGLDHLKFSTGLIEQLRRQGYTARPVSLAGAAVVHKEK
jgi:uncharacterized protein YbaP (TraB family)